MIKKFNLSEKIGNNHEISPQVDWDLIRVDDIKEFIKRLKAAFDNVEVYKTPLIRMIIDRLAGPKLITK